MWIRNLVSSSCHYSEFVFSLSLIKLVDSFAYCREMEPILLFRLRAIDASRLRSCQDQSFPKIFCAISNRVVSTGRPVGETELESPASFFRAPIFVPRLPDYDKAGRYGEDKSASRTDSPGRVRSQT